MNNDEFGLGGILFVIGLIAGNFQATLFLCGLGVVFMAMGLGTDACTEVFESFFKFFEDLMDAVRNLF